MYRSSKTPTPSPGKPGSFDTIMCLREREFDNLAQNRGGEFTTVWDGWVWIWAKFQHFGTRIKIVAEIAEIETQEEFKEKSCSLVFWTGDGDYPARKFKCEMPVGEYWSFELTGTWNIIKKPNLIIYRGFAFGNASLRETVAKSNNKI